jgi:hypothetical protein
MISKSSLFLACILCCVLIQRMSTATCDTYPDLTLSQLAIYVLKLSEVTSNADLISSARITYTKITNTYSVYNNQTIGIQVNTSDTLRSIMTPMFQTFTSATSGNATVLAHTLREVLVYNGASTLILSQMLPAEVTDVPLSNVTQCFTALFATNSTNTAHNSGCFQLAINSACVHALLFKVSISGTNYIFISKKYDFSKKSISNYIFVNVTHFNNKHLIHAYHGNEKKVRCDDDILFYNTYLVKRIFEFK